jgi:hypothetical protein
MSTETAANDSFRPVQPPRILFIGGCAGGPGRTEDGPKGCGISGGEPFDLLRNGTDDEIAAYHAGVAEVERIAASAGFNVKIGAYRDITDPLDAAEAAPGRGV